MKLALFGNGSMGRVAAALARARGHEIGSVLDSRDAGRTPEQLAPLLSGHDVAIDFSAAAAVLDHVAACVAAGVPLVEGTTGWQAAEGEARRLVEDGGGAMVYGANFSIGVNLFYRLVERAGGLFAGLGYDAFIEEAHHAKKRDAPSGTALRLRAILAGPVGCELPVASTRAGHIPGVHRVGFDSAADQVVLVHSARSREGFAEGGLAAARWIAGAGRRGVYAFADVLDEILDAERRDNR
ncbi:MAG TPA: dihydrodipicolinate reductase C-terminal domain-containing protein [Gemmatimonadales bacterium]|nr:dihydrodipicolinate reductase C-terminal domain-containing protein [Gemmatimonadales bacterium]